MERAGTVVEGPRAGSGPSAGGEVGGGRAAWRRRGEEASRERGRVEEKDGGGVEEGESDEKEEGEAERRRGETKEIGGWRCVPVEVMSHLRTLRSSQVLISTH